MNQLQNERYKRLQNIENNCRGAQAMHEAVENMKRQGLFRGEVYGPLGVEMNLKDSKWARFLEQVRFWGRCTRVK